MTDSNADAAGIDPVDPAAEAAAGLDGLDAELAELIDEAAAVDNKVSELTADLQRLQAEYANYRKRVERDRAVARENAIGEVLAALLPLIDDFGRASEHGMLKNERY